jgi:hypothetical protein
MNHSFFATLESSVTTAIDLAEKCRSCSQLNIFVDAHGHKAAFAVAAFTHGHNVWTEAMTAPTRIQLHVPLLRFLRLGTSSLPRKRRLMDPGCGAYGREGEDAGLCGTGTRGVGCHRRLRFAAFAGAHVRKTSVRVRPKTIK